MARGLADGLLRLCNGAWRDDDGDAVDIVEVVRCNNCDFFTEHNDVRTGKHLGYGECHRNFGLLFKDNDFCSYGERKG